MSGKGASTIEYFSKGIWSLTFYLQLGSPTKTHNT